MYIYIYIYIYLYIYIFRFFLEYLYLSNSYCFSIRKYKMLENSTIKYSYTYNEFQFGDDP